MAANDRWLLLRVLRRHRLQFRHFRQNIHDGVSCIACSSVRSVNRESGQKSRFEIQSNESNYSQLLSHSSALGSRLSALDLGSHHAHYTSDSVGREHDDDRSPLCARLSASSPRSSYLYGRCSFHAGTGRQMHIIVVRTILLCGFGSRGPSGGSSRGGKAESTGCAGFAECG